MHEYSSLQLVRLRWYVVRFAHNGRRPSTYQSEHRKQFGQSDPYLLLARCTEYGTAGNTSCNSSLGSDVAGSYVLNDVTQGDMDVNCAGTHNCYIPSGTNGVLSASTSSYQPAYATNPAGILPLVLAPSTSRTWRINGRGHRTLPC